MALLEPFKGYFFDPQKVRYEDVIIPPYDIISPKEKIEYRKRSPYNLINITLATGEDKEKYKKSKKFLDSLIDEKILIQDNENALYVVEQIDKENDKKRVFFLGAIDLTQYKKRILPHEKTFEEPKKDRKLLLKSLKANLGIPLMLYSDLHRKISGVFEYVMKGQPFVKFTDVGDIDYTIWKLTNQDDIKEIQSLMEKKKLYIADGHHRTESAYDIMKANPGLKNGKRMMMAIANYNDEEKEVLPTHRLVYGIRNLDIHKLEKQLTSTYFDIAIFEYNTTTEEMQLEKMKRAMFDNEDNYVIGMYYPEQRRYYAIRLKDKRKVFQWVEEQKKEFKDGSGIKKQLDVTWLHSLILQPFLGIDTTQRKQKNLDFVKGTHEDAIKAMAKDSKYQLLFFLNPIRLNDVIAIADEYDTVPQKTTYFYPKVDAGIIIQKLD